MSSPTSRSLQHLREAGFHPIQVVETWNSFSRKRVDLWGFVDILACHEGKTYGFQVTSGSNVSARRTKITQDNAQTLQILKDCGWIVALHGWSKKKIKRGGTAFRWTLKEEIL